MRKNVSWAPVLIQALLSLSYFFAALAYGASSFSALGVWQTQDEKTHLSSSLIQIEEKGGALVGRVIRICHPNELKAVSRCTKCSDDRFNQDVVGMEVIRHMRLHTPGHYDQGTVLDPRSGHVYKAKMEVRDEGKALYLRGYILVPLLGKTTVWHLRDYC